MSLGKAPCGFGGLEPYGMLSIVKEVMGKEKFILLIIGKNSIDENVRKG
jgi:electron transfer flavoprotein alpha/beta subunit